MKEEEKETAHTCSMTETKTLLPWCKQRKARRGAAGSLI
jgi:hypothetical protein